jgi:hypothetical protein
MTDNTTRRRANPALSNTNLTAVLAVLAGCEVLLIGSDFSNGVRFGLGGLVALALVAVVYRLGRNRADQRPTDGE